MSSRICLNKHRRRAARAHTPNCRRRFIYVMIRRITGIASTIDIFKLVKCNEFARWFSITRMCMTGNGNGTWVVEWTQIVSASGIRTAITYKKGINDVFTLKCELMLSHRRPQKVSQRFSPFHAEGTRQHDWKILLKEIKKKHTHLTNFPLHFIDSRHHIDIELRPGTFNLTVIVQINSIPWSKIVFIVQVVTEIEWVFAFCAFRWCFFECTCWVRFRWWSRVRLSRRVFVRFFRWRLVNCIRRWFWRNVGSNFRCRFQAATESSCILKNCCGRWFLRLRWALIWCVRFGRWAVVAHLYYLKFPCPNQKRVNNLIAIAWPEL